MAEINHKQMKELLRVYYSRKIPVMIHGTMGIGKSFGIREVAEEIAEDLGLGFVEGEPDGEDSFGFIDVRISQLEPSDIRGLPNIFNKEDGNQETKWITPNWLPQNSKSKGILFFDELNLAPPSIQAVAYQLILDRRTGDYKLPDGWEIMSAGNTTNDRANTFTLSAPLANRFAHLELNVPTKDEWVRWALNNEVDARIISFLEFKPSFLYKFDRNIKENSFATPRSWSFASKLIKHNLNLELDDIEILVSSCVGAGVGLEFSRFVKLQEKIDIKKILENPEIVSKIQEIDLKYSLLGAIVEKYREDKKVLDKILNVCNYLEPEFAILMLRFVKGIRADVFQVDVNKIPIWKDLANKYGKYIIDLND